MSDVGFIHSADRFAVPDWNRISDQSLQKSLNLSGDSSVYRTVCWMFLCPMYAWIARVSCPLEAR